MTINDFLTQLGENPLVLIAIFVGLPVIIFLYAKLIAGRKGYRTPHKYIYSLFVYLACIPGVFCCVLTGYSMFFVRQNMLNVNLLVYLLPIASMVISLIILKKQVNLDHIPGFDRLKGLMILMALAFLVGLFLVKLRFVVLFHSSILMLFIFALLAFIGFKWASRKLFKK